MNAHAPCSVVLTFDSAVAARRSADGTLLALCRRAERLLARDREASRRFEALQDAFDEARPLAPRLHVGPVAWPENASSATLRAEMKVHGHTWSTAHRARHRDRIRVVQAHERACAELRRSIGLTRAERASDVASARAHDIVDDVADLSAATAAGLAAKAAVLRLWCAVGYGLHDAGERLALGIAEDAERLAGVDRRKGLARTETLVA